MCELISNLVLSLSLAPASVRSTVVKKPAAKKPRSPKKAATAGKKEKKAKVCFEFES